jgi:putative FmdB family regulatory protein
MPTYEYACQKCGHRFDEFQSITAPPLMECPRCGGPLKRLIGPGAGFLFKGTGFYITDYRSKEYQKRAKEDQAKLPVSSEKLVPATKPDAPLAKKPEGKTDVAKTES